MRTRLRARLLAISFSIVLESPALEQDEDVGEGVIIGTGRF